MGVDVNRVGFLYLCIGSSLAGVAGILVAMYDNAVYPTMGYLAGVSPGL